MLHACEMNLLYTTSFILLSCILALGKCGSHFELIKNSRQPTGGQGTGIFPQKTFFQCDREPKCTHVMQRDGSEVYVMVRGEDALEKMTKARKVWKKMAINVVHENIALGKPSALSSVLGNTSFAGLAVNGKKETIICASTNLLDMLPWLRVDLQATAVVKSIRIFSVEPEIMLMDIIDIRAGNNFQDGGVRNPPCQLNVQIPDNSNTVDVQCPSNTIARYVTVNGQRHSPLQICEIEVYGYYI